MIWYKFRTSFKPAQISFQPRGDSAKYAILQGPSVYQFVGTNDHHWKDYSPWTILCEDLSGVLFRYKTEAKRCIVGPGIKKSFRCLGLRIWKTGGSNWISLSNIRMWKKIA